MMLLRLPLLVHLQDLQSLVTKPLIDMRSPGGMPSMNLLGLTMQMMGLLTSHSRGN